MTERFGDGFNSGYDPHWDDGGEESIQPEPKWRPRWRDALVWLLGGLVIVALVFGALAAGRGLYNPASRIPAAPAYPLIEGLFGANQAISAELEVIKGLLPQTSDFDLKLVGDVQRLKFPRTVLDRLLGEHNETATIFVAALPSGTEIRVLALMDKGLPTVFAVEVQSPGRSSRSIQGAFVGLPVASSDSNDPLAALGQALDRLMGDVDQADSSDVSDADFTIFGPFIVDGDLTAGELIETNVVLSHLVESLTAADADVSILASSFLVFEAPETGFIRALYQPSRRLVQKPLWRPGETPSLAHELVHAYVDLVLPNASSVLRTAANYFGEAHPRLHGEVVGDLYERLDAEGQAEETLAFIVGALANAQTKTIPTAQLLQNQGLLYSIVLAH